MSPLARSLALAASVVLAAPSGRTDAHRRLRARALSLALLGALGALGAACTVTTGPDVHGATTPTATGTAARTAPPLPPPPPGPVPPLPPPAPVATASASAPPATPPGKVGRDCTLKGKKLFGKVQIVTAFPDLKVQVVTSFPELKVEKVRHFADVCGKWEMVDGFPDLKIQIVDSFPDLKVQYVDAFPGLPLGSALASVRARITPSHVAGGLFVGWALALAWSGLAYAPGLHDNDFPLLVWLGRHARFGDLSTIAIGHYSPVALLILGGLSALGNALILAKLVNLGCVVGSAWLIARVARALTPGPLAERASWVAAACFMISAEPILLAQSEFGDPPVLLLYLLALDRLLAKRTLAGGVCLGAASLFRIYAPSYVLATLVLVVLFRLVPWREVPRLLAGAASLAIVQPILYWVGRRSLSSPVGDFVVGQVLFKYDEYDYLATWNLHPMREVLTHHREELRALVVERLTSFPAHLWIALVVTVVAALAARRRGETLLALLVAVYYVAYACLSWGITVRLMLLPVALLSIGVGVAARTRVGLVAALAAIASIAFHAARTVPEELASVRGSWARSAELTSILRQAGLKNAREAFVFDWDRVLTDDPTFEPYYNFGFWNALSRRFAAERPNALASTDSPEHFSQFLRENGARFVVFKADAWRFPAIHGQQVGNAPFAGWERIAKLPHSVVYRWEGPPESP